MQHESVIVSDPEILGGTPCFRGTRVPVDSLIDYLQAGDSLDEFLDTFPSVRREAAIAALEEAKALDKNLPYQQNLDTKRIAVLIVRAPSNRLQDLVPVVPECLAALETIQPRQVVRIGSLLSR